MDSDLNLIVHTTPGRPTTIKKMKTDEQTKAELRKLRKERNYNKGTEMLLAMSVATVILQYSQRLFIFMLLSILTINKQKLVFLLMVVKYTDCSTNIGNVTDRYPIRRKIDML